MGDRKDAVGSVGGNISASLRFGAGPANEEVGTEIGGLLDADIAIGMGGGTTIGPSFEVGIQTGGSRSLTLEQPFLTEWRSSLRGGVAADLYRNGRVGVRLRALFGADFVHVSGRRFSAKPESPDQLFAESIGPQWQSPAFSMSFAVLLVYHIATDANIVLGMASTSGPGVGRDGHASWQDFIIGAEWPLP